MIIKDNHVRIKTLDNLSKAKECTYYKILPTGELQLNSYFKSHVFLAYVCGNWFASYGARKKASISIPENGMSLFVHSNNSIWIQNDDNDVDFASSEIPLDESTYFALFAFSDNSYNVIMADGSKYSTPISTYLKKSPDNVTFLVFALTSFIRQHDEKAAEDILQFWFNKNNTGSSKKEYPCQIQFNKHEDISKNNK